ncbi:MAG TPA: cytochrome c oxidase subunit 3 [Fimbriimonadaceae bacterium]|nr:cytochrome c oxidase subunit 3 [Fimbriimonadaceae bacterium]
MATSTKSSSPVEQHGHGHDPLLHHQFEDMHQQTESYLVGMWSFLVTEIMFFGALFIMYSIYRWKYSHEFWEVHNLLDWKLGGINTFILLLSSFSMAMGVHYATLKKHALVNRCLAFTVLCACAFLVIKLGWEWWPKWEHNLFPGPGFEWNEHSLEKYIKPGSDLLSVSPNIAQLFLSLYFAMTGLHGIHVLVGILVLVGLMVLHKKQTPSAQDYVNTEMVGLYWHFVDLVWIFLYPLFYLIPK